MSSRFEVPWLNETFVLWRRSLEEKYEVNVTTLAWLVSIHNFSSSRDKLRLILDQNMSRMLFNIGKFFSSFEEDISNSRCLLIPNLLVDKKQSFYLKTYQNLMVPNQEFLEIQGCWSCGWKLAC